MNEMQKSQPPLHIKNPQKQQLCSIKKSKAIEIKISNGVDGVRKFTVKSRSNPYKRFRSKKRGLRSKMCQKSYLKTNIHRYVAKTESQQRAPYLHNATGHSKFLNCISVSGTIDKQLFTFLEGNRKQTQFHIWQGRVFTLHLSEKNPKNNRKTRS